MRCVISDGINIDAMQNAGEEERLAYVNTEDCLTTDAAE